MDQLDQQQCDLLHKKMAAEVEEARQGGRKLSLSQLISAGAQVLDSIPGQFITGRSAKHTRRRAEQELTAPVEFILFAPYVNRAAIRGDFTQWQDHLMEKGADGYFRVEIPLSDGEYQYKYCLESLSPWQLGQWVCITDPTATDVNSSDDEKAVILVKNGEVIVDEFEWRHDMNSLPPDNEMVIYELHVADFGGNLQGVIQKLDYLAGSGFNAIELMPVAEFPYDTSWGYNPKHFFAIESAYGRPTDLKQLVDECHARGIRIILDLVFNHGQQDMPLSQIDYNYWFVENNTDEFQFGPKFDYNHWDDHLKLFPARKFANEVAYYWATEYHLDGIRFDATALINNFDFLHWVGNSVKQANAMKPFYLVAEHLPIDPAIVGYGKPMDGLWHDYFYYQMTANLRQSAFNGWQPFDWEKTKDAIQPARSGIIGPTAAVQYLGNHDQSRLIYELATAGIMDDEAFRRIKLGYAVLFTSVGLPMLWMGDEFGQPGEKSMEQRPLEFELLGREPNADLQRYIKGLIWLRKHASALKSENIDFFHLDEANKVLAWKRWDDQGSLVAVVANFSDNSYSDYTLPGFPAEGGWHEYTFDYDLQVVDGKLVDLLGQSQCKIYIKQ